MSMNFVRFPQHFIYYTVILPHDKKNYYYKISVYFQTEKTALSSLHGKD